MNITSNSINYSTLSYPAAGTTKNKADRYASLRQMRQAEENEKVTKQLAALKKAKNNGTLYQKAPAKKIATKEECAQARFLLGLISSYSN